MPPALGSPVAGRVARLASVTTARQSGILTRSAGFTYRPFLLFWGNKFWFEIILVHITIFFHVWAHCVHIPYVYIQFFFLQIFGPFYATGVDFFVLKPN